MLKRIDYNKTLHNIRPWCPMVHIVMDDNGDSTLWTVDIGFDTDEDGGVAVRIKGELGVTNDVSMYVQKDRDGIRSIFAYKFDDEIFKKYITELLKSEAVSLLPKEERGKNDNSKHKYVEEVAIDFINEIIEKGEVCAIHELEFRENYNIKFDCAYYGGDTIWKNIRREEGRN